MREDMCDIDARLYIASDHDTLWFHGDWVLECSNKVKGIVGF